MTSNDQTTNEPKSGNSMIGRLLIVVFMGAVVVSECLFAYFWLPSADEVAAQMELVAMQSQAENGSEEAQANEQGLAIEVDLGAFTVTTYQMTSDSTFRTDFHLWGTVSEDDADEFEQIFSRNRNRFRNLVNEEIRDSDIKTLTDPGLGLIKRRFL